MKTLHLLRHAKSSWDHPGLEDFERPLNQRGLNDCKIMATEISKTGCPFENVFCSIANRAQMTIDSISSHLPGPIHWELDQDLYTFDDEELESWVCKLNPNLDTVMIIGHNPAITDFCNRMGDLEIENVPTCAYVQLVFEIDCWTRINDLPAKTKVFIKPKMFKL